MENVVIIGAGAIGKALGAIADTGRCRIAYWDIDAAKVPDIRPLEALVAEASAVLFCIPAQATRGIAERIAPHLPKHAMVVSVAKGLEATTAKTMDAVLAESLPRGQRFGLLFGPMLADELTRGLGGAGTVASASRAVFTALRRIFRSGDLTLGYSRDVRGVAFAGVLKNVYAIALGIAAGLQWGSDMRGWLIARAIGEMRILLPQLGGKAPTIFSDAGISDFVATGLSPCSRNWRVGNELATGMCYIESEGLLALPLLTGLLGDRLTAHLVLRAVADIALHRADARATFDLLRAEA